MFDELPKRPGNVDSKLMEGRNDTRLKLGNLKFYEEPKSPYRRDETICDFSGDNLQRIE